MKNIYSHFSDLQSTHPCLVIATITRCSGSTPQKQGSSALFGNNGLISGTIGGGILEANVLNISLKACMSGESTHPGFALNKDTTDGEDAMCGGQISVLIDANPLKHLKVFEELNSSVKMKKPGVLITKVTGMIDSNVNIDRYWITHSIKPSNIFNLPGEIDVLVNEILEKKDPSDFREIELLLPGEKQASLFFLENVFPPPSLVIAGAGHIGKALAHLGYFLDFEVVVIDDRPEFANSEQIPDADLIVVEDIGKALKGLEKNSETYIVIVTRGHREDAVALKACVGSEASYIGMIGSRNKIATMRRDFITNGWATEDQFDSINAPIGLDIKSKTVQEIAISIAAQIILFRNRGREVRGE